jgi:hypothetical protein
MVTNFKIPRLENKKWLIALRDFPCVVTGNRGGNDPAHIRYGLTGGMGLKPPDDLALPLRHDQHVAQHNHKGGEVGYWREVFANDERFMMDCLKAYARQLYRENNE